jgi:hypothetical protein
MQKHQKTLTKVACALIETTDLCLKDQSFRPSGMVLKKVTDCLGLTFKVLRELSLDRRSRILSAPSVNSKYRRLASSDVPVTKLLFGDDITGAVKAIDSSSKLGRNFTRSSKGRKFFPGKISKNWDAKGRDRNSYRGKYTNKPSFRGRSRGKGTYNSYSQKSQQFKRLE